jgi:hypothetical protein
MKQIFRFLIMSTVVILFHQNSFSQINLSNGLVADYPLDGDANDISPFMNNGTILGTGITNTTNRFGSINSALFVSSTNNRGLIFPYSNQTVFGMSLWINKTSGYTNTNQGYFLLDTDDNFGNTPNYSSEHVYGAFVESGASDILFTRISEPTQGYGVHATSGSIVQNNQWNHFFIYFNKIENRAIVYLNGNIVYTLSGFSNYNFNYNFLRIGNVSSVTGSGQLVGSVDDMKIYNRELNGCEVMALFNNTFSGLETPSLTISENVLFSTPSTFPGVSYSWSYNGSTLAGINTNTFTGTLNAGTYAGIVSYGSCSVSSAPYVLTAQIANIKTGLQAFYPLNGNANDLSGNGNNGVIVNAASSSVNRFSNPMSSYSFNGINSYIYVPNSSSLNFKNSFSVSTWVKAENTQNFFHILGKGRDVHSASNTFALTRNGFQVVTSTGTSQNTISSVNYSIASLNGWNFIVSSVDVTKNTMNYYLNSMLVATAFISSVNITTPLDFVFGKHNHAGAEYWFKGSIDNTRLYSRAINQLEISELYQEECPGFVASFSYENTSYPKTATSAVPVGTFTGGYFLPASGLSLNTITGEVNPSLSNPGKYVITYFVPAQYGCTSMSGTATITIANQYQTGSTMVDDCSTLPFYIPVSINTPIDGIIGLDVAFQYNPSVMSFTGNYLLGEVVTTTGIGDVDLTVTGNTIQTSIAYSGGEGTISGTGNIISYEFTLIPGTLEGIYTIPGGSLVESYYTSNIDANISFGVLTVQHYLPTLNGTLIYREDDANRVINNTIIGNSFSIISAAQNCVPTGTTTGTNDLGEFSIKLGEYGYSLSINRTLTSVTGDLITTSGIMSIINGMDANNTGKIANGKIANPTVYDLIAADVNNDGRVTSGDKTLINRRTVSKINNFPAPDWKFIPPYTTFTGFSKNNVPFISSCLTVPSFFANGCVQLYPQTYRSVLIGDVDGNYSSYQNNYNLREESEGEVVIDLFKAVKSGNNSYQIPVFVTSNNTVYAVDMDIKYDTSSVKTAKSSLNKFQRSANLDFNDLSGKLLITSDYSDGLDTKVESFMIEVKSSELADNTFKSAQSYVNGKRVSTTIKGGRTTQITDVSEVESIKLYPNPSEDNLVNVDFGQIVGSAKIEVVNIIGKSVLQTEGEVSSTVFKLDLTSQPKGIYLVKINVNGNSFVKKVVLK